MSIGRAIGFLAGGAMQGYGKGVVEQARLNWEKMLSDEKEGRADARAERQMTFEEGQTTRKIAADKDLATQREEGATERTGMELGSREKTSANEISSRERTSGAEIGSRERLADKELDEVVKVEPDQDGKLKAITKGGKLIDLGISGQAAAKELKLETDDGGAMRIVNLTSGSSRAVTDENGDPIYGKVKTDSLADLFAGPSGEVKPGGPKSKEPIARKPSAAPGLKPKPGAEASPKPDEGKRPPKPESEPDAQWSAKANAWVIQKDGKWFAVE